MAQSGNDDRSQQDESRTAERSVSVFSLPDQFHKLVARKNVIPVVDVDIFDVIDRCRHAGSLKGDVRVDQEHGGITAKPHRNDVDDGYGGCRLYISRSTIP